MNGQLLTGNGAAAWAARLARADYIPAYPITPQTEIVETIAKWVSEGAMRARLVQLESEHSMLTAAGSASLTGSRVFTATSSQGLLYGMEMLYNISGWRAPLVLVNVSRALAAPITLEPDHNDVLAARDSGFLQFHAANCQEVADLILIAYRVAEDRRVMLPAIVNLDGFYLSFTRERVVLPTEAKVDQFLPEYLPLHPFRATEPVAKGAAVTQGYVYAYFRSHTHAASLAAKDVFRWVAPEYEALFGRSYAPVEGFMLEDADYVLVMTNSFTALGKQAVRNLRAKGVRAGLLKLTMLRPFPADQVVQQLRGRKVVAVFDQNLAPGSGGILYQEVAAALYHEKHRPGAILPVVGGLGGKQMTPKEMESIFDEMRAIERGTAEPKPLFLLRDDELGRIGKALATAKGGD